MGIGLCFVRGVGRMWFEMGVEIVVSRIRQLRVVFSIWDAERKLGHATVEEALWK